MLIEFTGCSGAGKTTISKAVIEKLLDLNVKTVSIHPEKFSLGIVRVRNVTLQNLIMDLRALPLLVFSLRRNWRLLSLSIKVLLNKADSSLIALNYFRGILRRLGAYELQRKASDGGIVVLDECAIHIAHLLFVHLTSQPEDTDIARFAELVPLPDLIVWVRSPKHVLLNRTYNRHDTPIRDNTQINLEKFINQAYHLFEQLCSIERIKKRLLIVNYDDNSNELANYLGNEIVGQIMEARKNGTF